MSKNALCLRTRKPLWVKSRKVYRSAWFKPLSLQTKRQEVKGLAMISILADVTTE
jgi:hypothetical protein